MPSKNLYAQSKVTQEWEFSFPIYPFAPKPFFPNMQKSKKQLAWEPVACMHGPNLIRGKQQSSIKMLGYYESRLLHSFIFFRFIYYFFYADS